LATQAAGAMTAVPGKSLQSYEHLIVQNAESKENQAVIGTKDFNCATFEQHGKWFPGVDNYYKDWHHATDPKKEGVTGLVIFGLFDRLMDVFECPDGLEWVQDRLDKPVVPFPITI
jgi:hypothetical protein